jgi:hypothetical protein
LKICSLCKCRIKNKKLNVFRYPLAIGRYTSLNHAPDARNPHRYGIFAFLFI